MLETFDSKYGPVIGGAIGVAAGIWIVRLQHAQSVVVSVAAFSAALTAGIVGGYLMRYVDGTEQKPASNSQKDESPEDRTQ